MIDYNKAVAPLGSEEAAVKADIGIASVRGRL